MSDAVTRVRDLLAGLPDGHRPADAAHVALARAFASAIERGKNLESEVEKYQAALESARNAQCADRAWLETMRDEAAKVTKERDRMAAWLRYIACRVRGMGSDLARQAINSQTWPRFEAAKGTRDPRFPIPLEKP